MPGHPSGDRELNRQHIDKQRQGDKELAGNKPGPAPGEAEDALPPGRAHPDAEEGTGTTRNQRR